jgi:hypothetical protein
MAGSAPVPRGAALQEEDSLLRDQLILVANLADHLALDFYKAPQEVLEAPHPAALVAAAQVDKTAAQVAAQVADIPEVVVAATDPAVKGPDRILMALTNQIPQIHNRAAGLLQ